MTDQTMRDILARLEAAEARLATYEAAGARRPTRRACRAPRRLGRGRGRLGAAIVLALLLASVPFSLLATDRFPDVPASNPHHDDVNQIAAAGITIGFPDGTYRPDAFVTRGQMASFLARTAGLGGRTPVVNAATALTANSATNATNAVNAQNAITANSATTADTATSATNAGAVDGKSANELVRVTVNQTAATPVAATLVNTASVTITAPAAGFVLVNVSMRSDAFGGACPCEVRHRITRTTAPALSSFIYRTWHEAPGSSDTGAITFVFPVAAGVNTFAVQSDRATGTASFTVEAGISALYVPFGSTGGATLDLDSDDQPSESR